MTDPITTLRTLARKYTAVSVTFSDCGCCTVALFVGAKKIIEEDRDLSIAVAAVLRRIDEIEGVEVSEERLTVLEL